MAKYYWYKFFTHDTLWSSLSRPFPLQPLSIHEGPTTPEARSIYINGKSVGGELEFVEHTQHWIKMCHQAIFNHNSLFSQVKKWSSFTLAAVAHIQATKVHPHLTTLVACWSSPTRERISLLWLISFLVVKDLRYSFCRAIHNSKSAMMLKKSLVQKAIQMVSNHQYKSVTPLHG